MRAARAGDVTLMKMLLAAGADPRLAQENGNSPLLLSAGLGYRGPIGGTEAMALEAIAFSLEQGADINAVNAAGDTRRAHRGHDQLRRVGDGRWARWRL